MSSANEIQVGGDHYKVAKGMQHWDVMCCFSGDYLVGNATKYATRWRKKNGLQDLQKAGHYLQKLTELVEPGWIVPTLAPRFTREKFTEFTTSNDLSPDEVKFCRALLFWRSMSDLKTAREALTALEAECATINA